MKKSDLDPCFAPILVHDTVYLESEVDTVAIINAAKLKAEQDSINKAAEEAAATIVVIE